MKIIRHRSSRALVQLTVPGQSGPLPLWLIWSRKHVNFSDIGASLRPAADLCCAYAVPRTGVVTVTPEGKELARLSTVFIRPQPQLASAVTSALKPREGQAEHTG